MARLVTRLTGICIIYLLVGLWLFLDGSAPVQAMTISPSPTTIHSSNEITATLTHGQLYTDTITWAMTGTTYISTVLGDFDMFLDSAYDTKAQMEYYLITGSITISGTSYTPIEMATYIGNSIGQSMSWFATLFTFFDSPLLWFLLIALAWIAFTLMFKAAVSLFIGFIIPFSHFIIDDIVEPVINWVIMLIRG